MSIIDFNSNIEFCEKSWNDITFEYYENHKDMLPFKIGDKVRIVLPKDIKEKYNEFEEKIFNIVDIALTFNLGDEISYKLDTGIEICLFKSKYLELVEL